MGRRPLYAKPEYDGLTLINTLKEQLDDAIMLQNKELRETIKNNVASIRKMVDDSLAEVSDILAEYEAIDVTKISDASLVTMLDALKHIKNASDIMASAKNGLTLYEELADNQDTLHYSLVTCSMHVSTWLVRIPGVLADIRRCAQTARKLYERYHQ